MSQKQTRRDFMQTTLAAAAASSMPYWFFRDPAAAYFERLGGHEGLAEFVRPAAAALGLLEDASETVRQRVSAAPDEVSACATDYMRLFALTALGFLWTRMAEVALPKSNEDFYRAKLATARFYMQRILPQTGALHVMVTAGAAPVMELEEASF